MYNGEEVDLLHSSRIACHYQLLNSRHNVLSICQLLELV